MARQRQVSKEVKGTVNQVLTFNLKDNKLETVTITSKNTKQSEIAKEIEKALSRSTERKYLKVEHTEEVSEYRAMTEEKFLELSTTEKPAEDFISRTIKAVKANVLLFNLKTNALETQVITVTGETDEKTILRTAERLNPKAKVIMVQSKEESEELRFLTDRQFMEHSVKVEKGQSRIS